MIYVYLAFVSSSHEVYNKFLYEGIVNLYYLIQIVSLTKILVNTRSYLLFVTSCTCSDRMSVLALTHFG